MLTELRVRDLGVVEDLTLCLGPGMTALTGETGAGKTLLVEAIQLVLGGRAGPGLVRAGAAEATVEARFEQEGGETVLARTVPAQGRSRAWVDGRMAPVAALVEAGRDLVDVHGQHEQQSLTAPAAQRRALDAVAGVDPGPRRRARERVEEVDRRLVALGGDEQQRAREADVLRHQVAEIESARLEDPDEEAALRVEEERLADLAAHREAAWSALAALAGGATEGGATAGGALELLGRSASALAGRAAFDPWAERLRAALAELDDLASDLRVAAETWEDDPARLAEVQARRHLLADLRRKYGGGALAEVAAYGASAAERLRELEGAAGQAAVLREQREAAVADLADAEKALAEGRRAAAPGLAEAVGARLRDLAMPGARFEIAVEGPAGDGVQFLFGANPGEAVLPLARVASGGELARAMLALRLVAAGGPPTMVFDEVDAGVGGAAALALARALREVSVERQVLVVTHLPQVAAYADRQVAVTKSARRDRTVTAATELDGAERVVELSRMLSGHPDSATARAHAEELLASTTGGQPAE